MFDPASFQPYDPTQEPIFPPELKLRHEELCGRSEFFRSERMKWYRPATLGELLALKAEHPAAKIVVGNTELGVEMKFKNCHYPVMIQPSRDVTSHHHFMIGSNGVELASSSPAFLLLIPLSPYKGHFTTFYTLRRPVMGEVLWTRIWGAPPAGGPLL